MTPPFTPPIFQFIQKICATWDNVILPLSLSLSVSRSLPPLCKCAPILLQPTVSLTQIQTVTLWAKVSLSLRSGCVCGGGGRVRGRERGLRSPWRSGREGGGADLRQKAGGAACSQKDAALTCGPPTILTATLRFYVPAWPQINQLTLFSSLESLFSALGLLPCRRPPARSIADSAACCPRCCGSGCCGAASQQQVCVWFLVRHQSDVWLCAFLRSLFFCVLVRIQVEW